MVDYDFIMDGDAEHKSTLFKALSADEKAELLKVHRQRWLAANRHRLSAEQITELEDEIAFIRPELYEQPRSKDLDARAKELEKRAFKLFTQEEVFAMSLRGQRLPAPDEADDTVATN